MRPAVKPFPSRLRIQITDLLIPFGPEVVLFDSVLNVKVPSVKIAPSRRSSPSLVNRTFVSHHRVRWQTEPNRQP
jgi:hypothetical protein